MHILIMMPILFMFLSFRIVHAIQGLPGLPGIPGFPGLKGADVSTVTVSSMFTTTLMLVSFPGPHTMRESGHETTLM